MSPAERQRAARDAIKLIESRYGVSVVAVLQSKAFSPSAGLIEAAMMIELTPGWVAKGIE